MRARAACLRAAVLEPSRTTLGGLLTARGPPAPLPAGPLSLGARSSAGGRRLLPGLGPLPRPPSPFASAACARHRVLHMCCTCMPCLASPLPCRSRLPNQPWLCRKPCAAGPTACATQCSHPSAAGASSTATLAARPAAALRERARSAALGSVQQAASEPLQAASLACPQAGRQTAIAGIPRQPCAASHSNATR